MADDCNDCHTPAHQATHYATITTTVPTSLHQHTPLPPPAAPPPHEYLHLIDDLAYELDSLRVDFTQTDCQSTANALSESFESTLKELEQHNDRLQQALEEAKAKEQNCLELQQKNTDLTETIARLERNLEEKQDELDKAEQLIHQLSSMKCDCSRQSSDVTASGPSSSTAEQINSQISHFESELANANKIIEDLRIELTKRNEILAGSCHRDTELETYQVECNRLHKINQALTHEICRSSACRNSLERAKECIYAMHVEMARLHQHETQIVEAVRKESEQEVKHYRERYDEISKELNNERDRKSQLAATLRQVNKEQAESKKKNAELMTELHKLRSLFDVQRKTYENLLEKHDTLSNNFDLQSNSLHSCHKQIAQLQERFYELEKINKTDEVETRLLRDEVIYFKREISNLQSQLKNAEECKINFINKIEHLHMIINEQHKKLQVAEVAHKQIVDDLQRAKTEVSSRFDSLSQQYQSLEENYSKQKNYIKETAKTLESYRQWKTAQLRADEEHVKKYELYDEHVHLLLVDRQRFVLQLRDLHRDFQILQSELQRLQGEQRTLHADTGVTGQALQQRMHLLHQTLWRIAEVESMPLSGNKYFANVTQNTADDDAISRNSRETGNLATSQLATADSSGENVSTNPESESNS